MTFPTELPAFAALTAEARGGVLHVTIDSPPINLLGPAIVADLVKLIDYADTGAGYPVIVFSSADPDFFIPHVDVTRVAEYRAAAARLTGEASLGLLFRRLSTTKAVTIARVEGRVRGAGSEFVLACDMCFAALETAVFGQMEAGVGLPPGAGAIQHLVRLMGRSRALEVLLGADDFDAASAEKYGWINRAMPAAELSAYVTALAERIARFPGHARVAIKQRVNAVALAEEGEFRRDSDLFAQAMRQRETQVRVSALLDRGMQQRSWTEINMGKALGQF